MIYKDKFLEKIRKIFDWNGMSTFFVNRKDMFLKKWDLLSYMLN